jgi:hypothetical protein
MAGLGPKSNREEEKENDKTNDTDRNRLSPAKLMASSRTDERD